MRYIGLFLLVLSHCYWTPEAIHCHRHGGHLHKTQQHRQYESDHVIVKKTEIAGPGSNPVETIKEKRGFLANLANLLTEAEELSTSKGDHEIKQDETNNILTNHTENDSMSSGVVIPQHNKNKIKEIQVNASKDTEIPSVAPIFAYYHGKIVPLGEVNENSFKNKKQKSILMDNKEILSQLKNSVDKSKQKMENKIDESSSEDKSTTTIDKEGLNSKDEETKKDDNEITNSSEQVINKEKVTNKGEKLSHTKHKINNKDKEIDHHNNKEPANNEKVNNTDEEHDANWEDTEPEKVEKEKKIGEDTTEEEKSHSKEEKSKRKSPAEENESAKTSPKEEVDAKEKSPAEEDKPKRKSPTEENKSAEKIRTEYENATEKSPTEEEKATEKSPTEEVKTAEKNSEKKENLTIKVPAKEKKLSATENETQMEKDEEEAIKEQNTVTPKHLKPKPRIPKPSKEEKEEENSKAEKPESHPSFESKSNSVDENASRRGSQERLPHVKTSTKPSEKPVPTPQANHGISVLNQTQYKRLLHYLSTLEGISKSKEPSSSSPAAATTTTAAIAKDEVSFPDSVGSQKSEVLDHVKGILLDNGKVVPFSGKPTGSAVTDTASITTDTDATSHGESERFSVSEDGGLIPLNKDKAVAGESTTRDVNPTGEKTVSLSIDMLKGLLKKADSKVSLAQLLNRATGSSDADKKQNTQEEDPGTIEDFATNGLAAHNEIRKQHHSPDLLWSDDLASKAQKFAEELADKKTLEISKDLEKDGSGENVAKVWATFKTAGAEATKMWATQASNFRFDDPHLDENTGQFAQVVWKDTKELGMGVAKSIDDVNNRYVYVVALYHPAGNMEPTLRANVLPTGNNTIDVYSTFFKRTATKRSQITHHDNI